MLKNNENLVYHKKLSKKESFRLLRSIFFPIGVLLLTFFVMSQFGGVGPIVSFLVMLMWIFGTIVAFRMPAYRVATLNETHAVIVIYLLTLSLVKILIGVVSGVSTEMLIASFNENVSLNGGNTATTVLQGTLWITLVMLPVGFFGMQIKKLIQFRKTRNKAKTFEHARGIRNNNNQH